MARQTRSSEVPVAETLLQELEAERRISEQRKSDLSQSVRELNGLRSFGAAVNERLDSASIFDVLHEHLPVMFDYAALFVLSLQGKPQLFCCTRVPLDAEVLNKARQNFVINCSYMAGSEPVPLSEIEIVEDRTKEVFSGHDVDGGGTNGGGEILSHVTLPLFSGGDTLGGISIVSRRKAAFSQRDIQLFSLVSYQLSTALRNALLLKQTWEMAVHDQLTGVFNRRHFDERFQEEFRRSRRYGHPFSLIICDLDHFKKFNDTLGHVAGDEVLQAVAKELQGGVRNTDLLFRYGGEEFCVLLPESSIEEALLVAEGLRKRISMLPDAALGFPIRMSFGVAGVTSDDAATLEPTSLLVKADKALYQAKTLGRNRVCLSIADEEPVEADISNLERR